MTEEYNELALLERSLRNTVNETHVRFQSFADNFKDADEKMTNYCSAIEYSESLLVAEYQIIMLGQMGLLQWQIEKRAYDGEEVSTRISKLVSQIKDRLERNYWRHNSTSYLAFAVTEAKREAATRLLRDLRDRKGGL